jgi:glycosyltransferase involved in cell wall biosynthesis
MQTTPMRKQPLVTVYIPTRNRAAMVVRAVDSVLAQDYANLELIVIDDHSEDDTVTCLKRHPQRERFRLSSLPSPRGAPVARNLALELAQGEYITGMDDDDSMLPSRLSELLQCYRSGNWSCVASTYIEQYGDKEIVRTHDVGIIDYAAIRHYNKLGNQVLTETARLRAIGGFDPELPAFQDYDTWIRLLERFGPAFKLRHASYVAQVSHHADRITDDRERVRRAFAMFLQKHQHRLTPSHRRSMHLLQHAVDRSPLTTFEFIRYVNRGNYKMAVPLLIKSTPMLSPLKALLRARFRRLR